MNRSFRYLCAVAAGLIVPLATHAASEAYAANGATPRITPYNGWRVFEVITQGNNPSGDGVIYAMPGVFDGAGARLVNGGSRLRIQVNHETTDASISEVDLDVARLQRAIANVLGSGSTGGIQFVLSARQAYDRWSSNGGSSWTNTSSNANTSFTWFCSGQAYAANTFGAGRGFADPLYITGEETSGGRLFALDSANRDLYQLSGVVGSAPGGRGGMSFDAWENAALLDTGETNHVALLLSPDGGSQALKLYIGVKGRGANGAPSQSFLARNGLAYGSWYYLNSSLPGGIGSTNGGSFDTSASGALAASKMEDIDTNPSNPRRVVLGNQNVGVFTLSFNLVFSGSFNAGASSFTITKISNTSGGNNSLNNPDNVDWTAATNLGGVNYADGILFVNEDSSNGEIWKMNPNGGGKQRIGATTVGAESTGIFDISPLIGYRPGSVLVTNNQGSPSSMTVLINPGATTVDGGGDDVCGGGENASSCPADCSSDPGPEPGQCVDSAGFVDEQGYDCADWVGYDCERAVEEWGYSRAGENAIIANCRASCELCPAGSDPEPVCADTQSFADEQGCDCADWVGYDCERAVEDWGSSQAGENAITASCLDSCGVCAGP
jgi:hypothetical protein